MFLFLLPPPIPEEGKKHKNGKNTQNANPNSKKKKPERKTKDPEKKKRPGVAFTQVNNESPEQTKTDRPTQDMRDERENTGTKQDECKSNNTRIGPSLPTSSGLIPTLQSNEEVKDTVSLPPQYTPAKKERKKKVL